MTRITVIVAWLALGLLALAVASLAQGCASVAHPVSGPELVAQDGPEARDAYAEIREACDGPAHRTRARHTPVVTRSGYAVWCY